jgi:hypothetical protein
VIPSLNLLTGEVHIYKTAHHPRLATDYKVPVVDIALATSAAPSYFPTHRASDGLPLIDGGVWANNPVGFAAVEALTMLNWPAGDFKVLSLGCTSSPLDVRADSRFGWGWARWARNIADVMMAGQSSASLGMAKHLAGHDNVWRISPPVPPGRYGLDVLKELDSLRGLGNAEARTQSPYLGEFFTERAAPFAPFHEL